MSSTLLPGRRDAVTHSCGALRPHTQHSRLRTTSAKAYQGSSRSVLDAFFYGRAFAEVANQRLGELADEALVRLGKLDAERQQAFRDFFDEVEQKAQSELQSSQASSTGTVPPSRQLPAGGMSSSNEPTMATGQASMASTASTTTSTQAPPSQDLQEAVDELRAEVAATRAQLNQLKASPTKARASTAAGRKKPTKIPDARME